MLRGLSTLNLFADDLPAATRWYTEALGVTPYFTSEAAGRGPGYVEFRIGDYQHELGIIERRFAPPGLAAGPGGAIVYWHVDDVAAALERLLSLGAQPLDGVRERGSGFVTASVIDPFGNVVGIMYNRHYRGPRQTCEAGRAIGVSRGMAKGRTRSGRALGGSLRVAAQRTVPPASPRPWRRGRPGCARLSCAVPSRSWRPGIASDCAAPEPNGVGGSPDATT